MLSRFHQMFSIDLTRVVCKPYPLLLFYSFINSVSMKKLLTISLACVACTVVLAQKGKEKSNKQNNPKQEARNVVLGSEKQKNNKNTDVIWEGTKDSDGGAPKPSKNQPAKVRSAFAKDYPGATRVSWSKYRGDWTASFNNGIVRSVAIYHANGQRKDTRTVVQKTQLPRIILDDIFKRRPNVQLSDGVKIEVPRAVREIFRIKTIEAGTPRFMFYSADGKEVNYDY
jgi:hypothetical protein